MFVTLLLPLLLLLGPWGQRGAWGPWGWGPWGRPLLALGAVVPPSWADPRHNPCAAQPGGWQLILWPADGRCYRIFRRGHPCPPSMELTPGVGPGGAPGCRCPPGTALLAAPQAPGGQACHPLLEQGPCPPGQYLAQLPAPTGSEDRVPELRAACRSPAPCPPGHVFWARDGRCYPRLTRGPCYRGELLVAAASRAATAVGGSSSGTSGAPLGACRCEPRGELARYYSPLAKTCHEHYTPGPCQEKGLLFLPGGQCGCSPDLPHYHPATGSCYQIDTIGPCPIGHRFTAASQGRAQCRCKGGHVPWAGQSGEDGGVAGAADDDGTFACYRPWTRGPCPAGQLLSDAAQCVAAPCRPGRLYFPSTQSCYKVGVRGPCPKGQVVLFETAVRPALEGISYRGVCGCTGPAASRSSSNDITGKAIEDNRCGVQDRDKDTTGVKRSSSAPTTALADPGASAGGQATASRSTVTRTECESKSGAIVFNGTCHTLYSQGPCPLGQWLVPQRRGRDPRDVRATGTQPQPQLWSDPDPDPTRTRPRTRARCDCRPGHKAVVVGSVLECQPPTVVLASFLNARGFLTSA